MYAVFEVSEGCDKELNCLFCGLFKCDCEVAVFYPGRRAWHGAHLKCLRANHLRLQERQQAKQRSLSDRILSMVFAFDKDDSRRDEVRALASEAHALEVMLAREPATYYECDQCGARPEPGADPNENRCPNHAMPEPYFSCDGKLQKVERQ